MIEIFMIEIKGVRKEQAVSHRLLREIISE